MTTREHKRTSNIKTFDPRHSIKRAVKTRATGSRWVIVTSKGKVTWSNKIERVAAIRNVKYLKTTLEGIGAALTEGYRWNGLSTYLVYTAESRALATLEVSVHLDLTEDLPTDRYFVEIDIPDDIIMLELETEDLPDRWDSKPPILETQFIGDDFVKEKNAAVLKVPSSIVPQEFNYLTWQSQNQTTEEKLKS